MSGRAWMVLGVVLTAYGLGVWRLGPFALDDTYVTLRYAEHVVAEHALSFNSGGALVDGFASWLWLGVAVLASLSGLSLPGAMPVLSALAGAATVVVLWWHLMRAGLSLFASALALLVLASSAPFLLYAASGNETALFAFLLVATVLLWGAQTGRAALKTTLLIAGALLLMLCRPEGIVVLPVLLGVDKLRGRHDRVGMVATASAMAAASLLTLWHASSFGSALSPSFWNGTATPIGERVANNLRDGFVAQGYEFSAFGSYYAVVAACALGGWLVAGARAADETTRALSLSLVLACIYALFADDMPGMRLNAALLPLLIFPIAHAAGAVSLVLDRTLGGSARRARACLIVAVLVANVGWLADLKAAGSRVQFANKETREGLGVWMRAVYPAGTVIASDAVGIIPYFSGLETVTIQARPISSPRGAHFTHAEFFASAPEAVVLQSQGIMDASLLPISAALVSSPEFGRRYRVLAAVRYDWHEDRSYWVYVLRDRHFSDEELASLPLGIGGVRRVNP